MFLIARRSVGPERWYRKTPWIALAVLLLPPLGLFLVWRYSRWPGAVRSFALAWSIVFLVAALATLDGANQAARSGGTPGEPPPLPTPAPTPRLAAAAAPTSAPTRTRPPATSTVAATPTATPAPTRVVWFDVPGWIGRPPADFQAEFGPPNGSVRVAPGAVESAPSGGVRRIYHRPWGALEIIFDGDSQATGLYLVPTPTKPKDGPEALSLLKLPLGQPADSTTTTVSRWNNLGGLVVIVTEERPGGPVKDVIIRRARGAPPASPTTTATATPIPSPSPSPSPAAVGSVMSEPITVGPWGLVVGELRLTDRIGAVKAPPGRRFALVSLALGNFSDEPRSYNRFEFRLESGQGEVATPLVFQGNEGTSQLGFGELAPGGSVVGVLPFELSGQARDLALVYAPTCQPACPEQRVPLRMPAPGG